MDELQARIRAYRSLQTEMNLARQPSEVVEPGEAEALGEKNVVEMPERSRTASAEALSTGEAYTGDAVVKRTRRKSQSSPKPKAQKPASTKASSTAAFRQLREVTQPPLVDELQRLEAHAERINQLLAEQARRKRQQIQDGTYMVPIPQSEGAAIVPVSQSRRSHPNPRGHSAKGSQPKEQSYGVGEVTPMPPFEDGEAESLKAQADRINHLLAELEATIRQTGAIAQDSSQNQSHPPLPLESAPDQTPSHHQAPLPSIPPPLQGSASLPRGQEQISSLRQDLWRQDCQRSANQEAEETAQALRSLASRERATSGGEWEAPRRRPSHPGRSRIKRISLKLQQFLQVPEKPMDKLGDAVLWVVLAAVARVGSRFLLAANPTLAPILVILMLTPAILAVYLAVCVPKAGLVSVYRLFLITLGLLLGGKF